MKTKFLIQIFYGGNLYRIYEFDIEGLPVFRVDDLVLIAPDCDERKVMKAQYVLPEKTQYVRLEDVLFSSYDSHAYSEFEDFLVKYGWTKTLDEVNRKRR